jgi:hypothetical protein
MYNNNMRNVQIKTILFFIILYTLSQVSCQKSKEFIGYDDLVDDSPKLLWGSSAEELKNKYPNVGETINIGIIKEFNEGRMDSQIKFRGFQFINDKLFTVHVSYGNYSSEMLELLKEKIIRKYGKIITEDNGTIESWYIENNKNNETVILINKIKNNVVNCSYIFPPLRDESLKIPINEY